MAVVRHCSFSTTRCLCTGSFSADLARHVSVTKYSLPLGQGLDRNLSCCSNSRSTSNQILCQSSRLLQRKSHITDILHLSLLIALRLHPATIGRRGSPRTSRGRTTALFLDRQERAIALARGGNTSTLVDRRLAHSTNDGSRVTNSVSIAAGLSMEHN